MPKVMKKTEVPSDWENIVENKKNNVRYWDGIDALAESFIRNLMEQSPTQLDRNKVEMYVTETYKETLEVAIKKLEELGFEFPYVDENY